MPFGWMYWRIVRRLASLSEPSSMVFAFSMTYVLAKALNASIGLRVSPMEEEVGLDISSHGERSYS